jgi:hypothetical protein
MWLLLYIGEAIGQKAWLLKSFAPELSGPLVQHCMECEYLMNAMLAKACAVTVVIG